MSRPQGSCALHHPPSPEEDWVRADEGYTVCRTCTERLSERLAEIPPLFYRLNPRPQGQGPEDGRFSPGFDSTPCANVHVISLRDRRSSSTARMWLAADGRIHGESERPPQHPQNVLLGEAWEIAERRNMTGPVDDSSLLDLTRWLDAQLDYVSRQGDLVVSLNEQVGLVLSQLRLATGHKPAAKIGHCPEEIDGELCGAELFAPGSGDTIACRACGTRWPRPRWERLGQIIQQRALVS